MGCAKNGKISKCMNQWNRENVDYISSTTVFDDNCDFNSSIIK